MFQHWLLDNDELHEKLKNYSTYIGSFSNPEMAKQAYKRDNPDFASSDDDFEESSQMVLEDRERLMKRKRTRKRILARVVDG